jgi:alkylation response protein AidB-like acyl-CoA dehydrogenase
VTEHGPTDLLAAARALGPEIRTRADEAESMRRLPHETVRLLTEAGLMKLCLPEEYGGPELDPVSFIEVVEEVSRHDGAAGWCVMIASTTSPMAAYLPEDEAARIYGSDPLVITGGAIAPSGAGRSVEGGYEVTGRWQWGSGTQHCSWIVGGTLIDGGDYRLVFFPASDVEIIDTWYSSGLRGTGSNDFAVNGAFVPAGRAVTIVGAPPRLRRPAYLFPIFSLLSLAVASVCLGIARRAIDELVELAEVKTPAFSAKRLAASSMTQVDVAKAEAALGSARAFLVDEVSKSWEDALAGREVSLDRRARVRLASATTGARCVEAVDLAYHAGGGSSVYAKSPLQRCFRDIHTASQHIIVAPRTYELFGRLRLGAPADTSML